MVSFFYLAYWLLGYYFYIKLISKIYKKMKTGFFTLIPLSLLLIINSGCVQPESIISSSNGNLSPVVKSVSVDPLYITVGSSATITVDAADPDGDAISFSWSTPLGDIIGSGSQVRYTAAYCCVGTNSITIIVEDTRGAKVSKTVNIEINP